MFIWYDINHMNPVVNPVVIELDFIGQGGPRAISGGTHTQSIIEGGENIVHGDVITHMLTNLPKRRSKATLFRSNQIRRRRSWSYLWLNPFWQVMGTYAPQV